MSFVVVTAAVLQIQVIMVRLMVASLIKLHLYSECEFFNVTDTFAYINNGNLSSTIKRNTRRARLTDPRPLSVCVAL